MCWHHQRGLQKVSFISFCELSIGTLSKFYFVGPPHIETEGTPMPDTKESMFNLGDFKGKLDAMAKDNFKAVRPNGHAVSARDLNNEVRSSRSTTATKSTCHSSATKNPLTLTKASDSYMSTFATPANRGISEEALAKMKEDSEKNVKKMYLSKFNKVIKVKTILISLY